VAHPIAACRRRVIAACLLILWELSRGVVTLLRVIPAHGVAAYVPVLKR
jgi:hypothetical protein